MSLAVGSAAVAGALLLWPGRPAPARLTVLRPVPVRTRSWRTVLRTPTAAVVGAGVLIGALAAGTGGAIAAAVVGATAVRTRRTLTAERGHEAATQGLAEGLASFAAEVRSGAPPGAAAETAAGDAHPVAARAFGLVAATARLGGDVPTALRSAARGDAVAGEHLDRLAAAWALADRHGIALAGPAEAVAVDLRARARVAGRLRAQLAGPRATATVLAGLPVLGVGLGEGVGARPWAVLSGSALGQVLLVVGVGLVCAGVLWTARIAAGVAR